MRILAWPFVAAWALITLIFSAIGRMFAFGMGRAIAGLGVILCLSIVGMVLGIPMVLFGGALMCRSIF